MDGITSVGGDLVEVDKWGVDVAIVGSQKCLAAPAGLAAVAVSSRAWERLTKNPPVTTSTLPRTKRAPRESRWRTRTLRAVPLFLALREACLMIEEEALANRIARHQKMAKAVRAAAQAWGLSLFPNSMRSTRDRLPLPRSVPRGRQGR